MNTKIIFFGLQLAKNMKQNNKKIQPFSTIYILFKKKNFTSAWFKKKRGGGANATA